MTATTVADVATFVAFDRAAAMTGAIANLSGGMIADWTAGVATPAGPGDACHAA
ncbi:hypothetical protein [Dactylosporangium darangshiense]|uniref:Uncharacterized protein n=1 Tax=Dactylosporangium darangshiense TaxID=579108 RepID=A0ABP8DPU7_9ACTN